MKVHDIKRFYVQNTITDREIVCHSLTHACEIVINQHDENNLIHIGGYNLDYYRKGDSVNSLFLRCVNILSGIEQGV